MNIRTIITLSIVVFGTTIFPASAQSNDAYISLSSKVKYQYITTYDTQRLHKILTTEVADFSPFKVSYPSARYPVKLYRVSYSSVVPEDNNRPTVTSGLIAIPETENKSLPVVSYQHGTVFSKMAVPSHPDVPGSPDDSMETRLMIAQFAGQGYIVIGADYFGKGLSKETDGYLVKASAAQACLDMLKAAKVVSAHLKVEMGQLFLSGWSQGSWNTLAFLNKLESLDIPVRAAAVASAPTDLYALMNRWIHAPADIDATYLFGLMALQLNAYEKYYKLPGLANSAIKPEYQQLARDFYLNKITSEQFFGELESKGHSKLNDFLQESFMDSSSIGNSRFWQIVQENQSYRWRSNTPVNTYYGDVDEVIPEYIAKLPVDYQSIMGGAKTTAIAAGAQANHRGTFLYAVEEQKKWFDQLLSQ